jgi:hypothetical protein
MLLGRAVSLLSLSSCNVHTRAQALGTDRGGVADEQPGDVGWALEAEPAPLIAVLLDRGAEGQSGAFGHNGIEGQEAAVANRHLLPRHQALDVVYVLTAEAARFWCLARHPVVVVEDTNGNLVAWVEVRAQVLDLTLSWPAHSDMDRHAINLFA